MPRTRRLGALPCALVAVAVWAVGLAAPLAASGAPAREEAVKALTLIHEGRQAEAEPLLGAAIEAGGLTDPILALLYVARAQARVSLHRDAAAMDDLSEAIARDPARAEAYFNRAWLHYRQANFDQAIADYTAFLALGKPDARAYNNRGAAWRRKGNLESALANYSRAVALDPADPDYLLNRGMLYEDMDQEELARADYLQAKRISPNISTPLD